MLKKSKILVLLLAIIQTISSTAFAGTLEYFKKTKTYNNEFKDLAANAWYIEDVKTCYELQLMKGKAEDKFYPEDNLTIAEAITMASRVKSIYETDGQSGLKQGEGENWYAPYVTYAIMNKMITVTDFYDYNDKATRAEMAYIFSNAISSTDLEKKNTISAIPDVNNDTKFSSSIYKLYEAGIVIGNDEKGTFKPTSNITRAEASAIINRIIIKENRKSITL